MTKRKAGPALLAAGLFLVILWTLLYRAEAYLEKADPAQAAAVLYPPVKMQGLILQDKALERQAQESLLPVYGSSELTLANRFHPSSFFTGEASLTPFVSGRGGCQSLIHALNFAALGEKLQGKKVVLILSPQWFGREGLSQDYFRGNFSPLHAYSVILDQGLDPRIKQALAARMLDFSETRRHPLLFLLLEGLSGRSDIASAVYPALRPVAYVNRWFLTRADRLRSAYLLWSQGADGRDGKPDNSWKLGKSGFTDAERKYLLDLGAEEGKKESTTNAFYISDESFNRRFAAKFPELQNSEVTTSYVVSPEYDDLRLLLSVLKNAGAEALFVLAPVNGFWYDYIGFPKSDRTAHYVKTKELITSAGYAACDLTSFEYEPYFLWDDMHLGWKGWVYVDEALAKFYFAER